MAEPTTPLERLEDRLGDELAHLRAAGRYYLPNIVSSAQGPRLTLDGVSCVNLACNNYLSSASGVTVLATFIENEAGSVTGCPVKPVKCRRIL